MSPLNLGNAAGSLGKRREQKSTRLWIFYSLEKLGKVALRLILTHQTWFMCSLIAESVMWNQKNVFKIVLKMAAMKPEHPSSSWADIIFSRRLSWCTWLKWCDWLETTLNLSEHFILFTRNMCFIKHLPLLITEIPILIACRLQSRSYTGNTRQIWSGQQLVHAWAASWTFV